MLTFCRHYIWSDYFPTSKPVTLVPEYQLLALIDEINEAFPNAKITITDDLREEGLVINFDDCRHELRPRFLGHSTSRAQQDYWTNHLPLPIQVGGSMADRSLDAWKAKMELAIEIARNKTKAAKSKRQGEAVAKRQDMVRNSLRVQRYLGLMPKGNNGK